jgi:hypothetical protein
VSLTPASPSLEMSSLPSVSPFHRDRLLNVALTTILDDFTARSPDELNLRRGDRIELIERDDEFGDGWFLGRHIKSGATGLFPEGKRNGEATKVEVSRVWHCLVKTWLIFIPSVYTTHAAQLIAKAPGAASLAASTSHNSTYPPLDLVVPSANVTGYQVASNPYAQDVSVEEERPSSSSSKMAPTPGANAFAKRAVQPPIGLRSASAGSTVPSTSNPVMDQTLSVIEEHITDMNTPRQSLLGVGYTAEPYTHRLSYINGQETDEEDGSHFTEREVRNWTPAQVAEQLEQLGADRAQCKAFQDEEITGDVMMDMDRDMILLKTFDLGTIGRRLALWGKISKFQAEIKGYNAARTPSTNRTGSMTSYSESIRDRAFGGMLPKIPNINDQKSESPTSSPFAYRQRSQSQRQDSTPMSDSKHISRPSQTSIRSVPHGHNRRHSSLEYGSGPNTPIKSTMEIPGASPRPQTGNGHAKQNSLDRSWTMMSNGTTAVGESGPNSGRMFSPGAGGSSTFLPNIPHTPEYGTNMSTAVDLERGYFSSNENESRKFKNVLKKRESEGTPSGATHTRAPSDGTGSRLSGVFRSIHSRGGSTDNMDGHTTDVEGKKKRNSFYSSLRGKKVSNIDTSIDSTVAGATSPTVSPSEAARMSPRVSAMFSHRHSNSGSKKRISGLRAISDAVTGGEKQKALTVQNPTQDSGDYRRDAFLQSPTKTDSSAQSVASGTQGSLDDKAAIQPANGLVPVKHERMVSNEGSKKKKGKHETSAYIRGLEKKSPAEQIAGSDYSGWMRKKSKKLGKWHSRLFVLRGRRLSYYYTEDDTEEKGLIDISFHRVLPANKDLLTGFHAAVTGAGSSPVGADGNHGHSLQTAAQADMDVWRAQMSSMVAATDHSIFIFKLVPPRPGMSKTATVNFTQPKVHFFAVSSLQEGRNWMAALMKATIERDELKLVSSTYKEKTISLIRARELRVRPKEFLNEGEVVDGADKIKELPEEEKEVTQPELPNEKEFGGDGSSSRTGTAGRDGTESLVKEESADGWSLVNVEKREPPLYKQTIVGEVTV